MPDPRYALYFAPAADTLLWEFASRWLGRDAVSGVSYDQREITASPRLYGFHATLKPPFHLADGCNANELRGQLSEFVRRFRPFYLPKLRLSQLGRFLALTLTSPSMDLRQLADQCVSEFDWLRRRPSPEEILERRQGGLTAVQDELLQRWGYPYVFEEWQFHMTLTSSLRDPAHRIAVFEELSARVTPYLNEPLRVDAVCLFVQPERGQPFRITDRFGFPR